MSPSSSTNRKQCANDDNCKQGAVTICEGCSQSFCLHHMIEHRHQLEQQMKILLDEHNQLKNIFKQQKINSDAHPFIHEINDWEKSIIEKIQQRANDLRQQIHQLIIDNSEDMLKKLEKLYEQLKHSRKHNDFIEMDLQRWQTVLNEYKRFALSLPTISIQRNDNCFISESISINSLSIPEDLFEQVSNGSVQIEQNGQVIIHDNSNSHVEIRGKNEYVFGCHEIRLCIEESSNIWMFLGVTSKLTKLCNNSMSSKSTYGWTNDNSIWSNGQCRSHTTNPQIEMKEKDVIRLIFNCNTHTISMINERTNAKFQLNVDLCNCPFPWQLHINLLENNSQIRLVSTHA